MSTPILYLLFGLLVGFFAGYALRDTKRWRAEQRRKREDAIVRRWNYRQARRNG